MPRTLSDILAAAATAPRQRFLTTAAGRINFRNCLARRRRYAKQFRKVGYGTHICAAALRTDVREEREARADNPLTAAADLVDGALFGLGIEPTDMEREYAILAYHEGRPAVFSRSRYSSLWANAINLGLASMREISGPDVSPIERLAQRADAAGLRAALNELSQTVALNAAGAAFLKRAESRLFVKTEAA